MPDLRSALADYDKDGTGFADYGSFLKNHLLASSVDSSIRASGTGKWTPPSGGGKGGREGRGALKLGLTGKRMK